MPKNSPDTNRQTRSLPAPGVDDEPIVFIVDDEEDVRESLVLLMKAIRLKTKTFACGDDFLGYYNPAMLGCLVLDVRLPGMSGLQLQDELLARNIDLPIIFISGYADLPMAVAAMKKGAFDFLEKPIRGQALLDGVNAAIKLHRERQRAQARTNVIAARIESLTPRERQVLDLIKLGKSTREIATALRISQKTTQVHRARVLAKLQVDTTEALVTVLHRHNLA